MTDRAGISDTEVLLRVYDALLDQAGVGESWALDLAILGRIEASLQDALDYAESDRDAEVATVARNAAVELKRAIAQMPR